jgi:hypothetical protein
MNIKIRHTPLLAAPLLAAGIVVAGCGSGTPAAHAQPAGQPATSAASSARATPTSSAPHTSPTHHLRHHHALAAAHRTACGTRLWAHIYHPDRLRLIQRCKTVHGTVKELAWEPDGDLHIRLATRPALVNSANDQYEQGDLVLEEICLGSTTQADAVAACRGVPHNLTVPSVGDKVTVTGSYVLDQNHGWLEIHPVTSLTVTGHVPPPPPSQAAPPSSAAPAPAGCHPTTPSGNCYEPGEYCPTADAGMTGVAGDGKTIICELESGRYHWHPVG